MVIPDPAVATALSALELARAGRYVELRDMFAPQLQPLVSAEALRAGWQAGLDRYGAVTSIGTPVSESVRAGIVVVTIPIDCERGQLAATITVTEVDGDGPGELAGMQFLPVEPGAVVGPWEPPSYVDTGEFSEQDVLVGSGPLAVPGTLTLPTRSNPSAAIVFLGGSGPADRDESVGQNKPFKDLALGLASRGIAVLRFDKVTFAHRAELLAVSEFTLADEYLPDALAAIELLSGHPDIDADRIFLLGHSLGGTVAPRVAAEAPSLAGLVILAGGTQPLQWAIVRQLEYIASLDPETAETAAPGIAEMVEKARRVDSAELNASTPSESLPFGVAPAYWLDLRGYDPVATAAAFAKPMLFLQGARDYQATVGEDLASWKAGLDDRGDVTFRIYPDDNHFFLPGSGPSSPAEYGPGQHVDPAVIADIATWVATVAPA